MQIFYDPKTMQVMAVYRGCRYSGTAWQDQGFAEAQGDDNSGVTRDHTVTVEGGLVTGKTASPNPVQKTPPTDEERIDDAFPQTDTARVIFEAIFELANRVKALEDGGSYTRAQVRDWLKAKLP